jgi:UDP-N-acetylglucosamine--N-acetylmuramyl-(pentapeptide) pyrophosphoryl-undecaprenol N-acetylglucosamine transferase
MAATPLRVVVAGGGTGGHLFAGIAVAREIVRIDPGAVVSFAGTAGGIEARVVPREGYALDVVRSAGLKGKSAGAMARGLATVPASLADAWRIVSRRRPDLVIGLGGYSSGAVVLVAALRRVRTLVMEQNAMPGFTNRRLAGLVDAAAVAYDATLAYFGGKGFLSGNPVRGEFAEIGRRTILAPAPLARARFGLLVFGGSQGAHAINVAMSEAAPHLAAGAPPPDLTHQTGERDAGMVRDAYRRAGLPARVEPFLDEMAREMEAADLVVCRAGASTLAEIAAAARPAILVPLPTATDDHQRKNAEVVSAAGAADVIDQRDLTGPRLAERICALAADPARRRRMAEAAWRLARPDAASLIADRAVALARRRRGDGDAAVRPGA